MLCAFALAPDRLGGIRLRMPAGPPRDALLDVLRSTLVGSRTERRLPISASDEALLGGPDLAASLEAGRLVRSPGILTSDSPFLLIVPMAERMEARVAAISRARLMRPWPHPLCVWLSMRAARQMNVRPRYCANS